MDWQDRGIYLLSFVVFYSVIGGWIVIYFAKGLFGGIISEGADYSSVFNTTIENPVLVVAAQFVFLAITVAVVAKGFKMELKSK